MAATLYTTELKLIEAYTNEELKEQLGWQGVVDSVTLLKFIDRSSRTIDDFLRARYAVPITQVGLVPQIVENACNKLVRKMYHSGGAPEVVETDYKGAIKSLKDMAMGMPALALPLNANAATNTDMNILFSGKPSQADPLFAEKRASDACPANAFGG